MGKSDFYALLGCCKGVLLVAKLYLRRKIKTIKQKAIKIKNYLWYKVKLGSDEFDGSLELDINKMAKMDKTELDAYCSKIAKKRGIAHALDIRQNSSDKVRPVRDFSDVTGKRGVYYGSYMGEGEFDGSLSLDCAKMTEMDEGQLKRYLASIAGERDAAHRFGLNGEEFDFMLGLDLSKLVGMDEARRSEYLADLIRERDTVHKLSMQEK